MANEVKITKTVYDSTQFNTVVDREFKTFAQPPAVEEQVTVQEFFALYEELYYDIPIKGEGASHEYLVKRSSELINFEKDTEDIQPLLDEISTLRAQILEYQQQLIEANTPST